MVASPCAVASCAIEMVIQRAREGASVYVFIFLALTLTLHMAL